MCNGQNFFENIFKKDVPCLMDQSYSEQNVVMYYFIATTISTVGLGDYAPISNLERMGIIPYLFFGQLIFSYMISRILALTRIIHDEVTCHHDTDRTYQNRLQLFLRTLSIKNDGKCFDENIERQMNEYFEFFWRNHSTLFLENRNGERHFEFLPSSVKLMILRDFCYPNFLMKFKKFF